MRAFCEQEFKKNVRDAANSLALALTMLCDTDGKPVCISPPIKDFSSIEEIGVYTTDYYKSIILSCITKEVERVMGSKERLASFLKYNGIE